MQLPLAPHLSAETLRATLVDEAAADRDRLAAGGPRAYVLRRERWVPVELTCLTLGAVYVLDMPGELFVDYQLAARRMRSDAVVCMAAYGDPGPGSIGTEVAYARGADETRPSSSPTAPTVERVLLDGMRAPLANR